jgi:nitroimidazol reductase NimA-like FMN-containing flavoprotein (pyridoxamine 5'-phosphate oxidase superfamily)
MEMPMQIPHRARDRAWAMAQFEKAEYATVAAMGTDGYPYNVPLLIFRVGDNLCFHTAQRGHLCDLLAQNPKVCVTCVTQTAREPEHTTVRYRSAMAFGEAVRVTDKAEAMEIMRAFFAKYLPRDPREDYLVDRVATIASIYTIRVESATGKESATGDNV